MEYKIIIVALLAIMIYNLFRAMVLMNKNDPEKPPMSKYIGRRVMLSGLIVLILIIGLLTGYISPNPRPY
ncbi:DUF2909 domain-containing protein [Thalassotalea sp. ND16A]|uniref:DUF2909 domain-containing protein n=1 Tax=Thalassotalea sp. ND16A TaxID=1535422 RepID=UPI00051A334E|nr:DUF2909 domain-containing protein [Thalassotalea sp. ND16A]KGK00494.1 hypothetical protein ND16A_3462 [Thalassotalea sp. ND16A]